MPTRPCNSKLACCGQMLHPEFGGPPNQDSPLHTPQSSTAMPPVLRDSHLPRVCNCRRDRASTFSWHCPYGSWLSDGWAARLRLSTRLGTSNFLLTVISGSSAFPFFAARGSVVGSTAQPIHALIFECRAAKAWLTPFKHHYAKSRDSDGASRCPRRRQCFGGAKNGLQRGGATPQGSRQGRAKWVDFGNGGFAACARCATRGT